MKNKTFIILLSLLLPLLMINCQPPNPAESPDVEIKNNKFTILEKQIEVTSHLYLHPIVNDSIRGVFLFDSGANGLILDEKFSKENKIPIIKAKELKGENKYSYGVGEGRLKYNFAKEINLKFDGKDFLEKEVRVMKLDSLFSEVLKHEINGIIGYDLFSKFKITIDFDNEKITLDKSLEEERLNNFQKIKYKKEYRKPMVDVVLELENQKQLDCKLIFDMGAGQSISLSNRKSTKENLFHKIKDLECETSNVAGIGGHSQSCYGVIKSLKIGKQIELSSIAIELGKDSKGALGNHKMYDGLLGMEIIKNFNIIIDQENQFIYLQKRGLHQ